MPKKKTSDYEIEHSDSFVIPDMISSGSLKLDYVIEGGVAKGRISCIYGPESSGKTTLSLQIIALAQKTDERPACYIEVERTYTHDYAQTLGIDTSKEKLHVYQPVCAEDCYDFIEAAVAEGKYSCIVVDSIPALQSKAVLSGDSGDYKLGVDSKLLGTHTMNVLYNIKKSNTALIYLNQGRKDFTTGKMIPYGGTAFRHNCSLILKLSQTAFYRDKSSEVELDFSKIVHVVVQKNKLGLKDVDCNIYYTDYEGFDYTIDVFTLAIRLGILEKAGAWIKMGDEWKVNGAKKAIIELKDNPDLFEIIEKKVKDSLESQKD